MKPMVSTGLRYTDHRLEILDQTLLPQRETWLTIASPDQMVEAIRSLRVRGAPLIGVAAAIALGAYSASGASVSAYEEAAKRLRSARPTAVNLMSAIDRCLAASNKQLIAETIFEEDVALCAAMGQFGANIIQNNHNYMTICNAGSLATAGIGTALGVFAMAKKAGKSFHVFVPETRPLLQGARLTAWELDRLNIPFTLVCDNMIASVMQNHRISAVFVGADRIAANGDFANKIGTCGQAIIAKHFDVPFYVVAPYTTVDLEVAQGNDIPIEERSSHEVLGERGLAKAQVFNPAFDVTPAALVSGGWILDKGVIRPPIGTSGLKSFGFPSRA